MAALIGLTAFAENIAFIPACVLDLDVGLGGRQARCNTNHEEDQTTETASVATVHNHDYHTMIIIGGIVVRMNLLASSSNNTVRY